MVWKNLPADDRDFPGDSEERSAAALATAGSLSAVETFISDWGDYAGDHSADELAKANGEIGSDRHEVYHDSCNSADNDIRIK